MWNQCTLKPLRDAWRGHPFCPAMAHGYTTITLSVPLVPSFNCLDMPSRLVEAFSRLRLGTSLLSRRSFRIISSNSSPLRPLHTVEAFCGSVRIKYPTVFPFPQTDTFSSAASHPIRRLPLFEQNVWQNHYPVVVYYKMIFYITSYYSKSYLLIV